jgi:hypothetical protein
MRTSHRPLAASTSATPVWNTTAFPDSAVSCATASACPRGLPMAAPFALAT